MFRLQNNVPEVYVQESRDFQLFCRLYDAIQAGVKFSTDSLAYASSTKNCNSRLLDLLKTKVGLFFDINISDDNLRLVIDAFPHIMKNKGSVKGIKYIVNLFSRLTNEVDAIGSIDESALSSEHVLRLTFENDLKNDQLLIELLKYVIPTGYFIEYEVAKKNQSTTNVSQSSSFSSSNIPEDSLSNATAVHSNKDEEYYNNVGLTQIASSKSITTGDNTGS